MASVGCFCTYFYFIFSSCKLRLYNFKSTIVVYTKKKFMFIHLQFCCRIFFFTLGDFNFDWPFFTKLIWWIRTRPIFSKFNQTDLIKQKCVNWFSKVDQISFTVYWRLYRNFVKAAHFTDYLYISHKCVKKTLWPTKHSTKCKIFNRGVRKKSPRKKAPPWEFMGRVRVRLGTELGLGSGGIFSGGIFS